MQKKSYKSPKVGKAEQPNETHTAMLHHMDIEYNIVKRFSWKEK